MSFQSRNRITNQAAYTYPRATVGDTVFYRLLRWRTRTGSGDNLAICPNIVIVPNPKQAYA